MAHAAPPPAEAAADSGRRLADEPLQLDAVAQAAYDAATRCLLRRCPSSQSERDAAGADADDADDGEAAGLLREAPTVVPLAPLGAVCRDHATGDPTGAAAAATTSLLSLGEGHRPLAQQLERLEALDAPEAVAAAERAAARAPVPNELVRILLGAGEDAAAGTAVAVPSEASDTGEDDGADGSADLARFLARLAASAAVPRRQVCQHPFKRNDIVWVCRTCQADETCVLCHDCFSQSHHEGHDVAFYHAQAGGCCDCGDADAWDPAGFCPRHGPPRDGGPSGDAMSDNGGAVLSPPVMARVRGAVPAAVDWLVREVVRTADRAYARTHPPPSSRRRTARHRHRGSGDAMARMDHIEGAEVAVDGRGLVERSHSLPEHFDSSDDDSDSDGGAVDDEPSEMEPMEFLDDDGDEAMEDDSAEEPPAEGDASSSSLVHGPLVFSPAAASANRWARRRQQARRLLSPVSGQSRDLPEIGDPAPSSSVVALSALDLQDARTALAAGAEAPALRLGRLGAQGGGLYIVLFADDIHSTQDLIAALKEFFWSDGGGPSLLANVLAADALLTKLVRALRHHGYLVVWGPIEFAAECGMTQLQLWMDGDKVASTRIGAVCFERASRLTKHGMFCSIFTHEELVLEQRAIHVVQWLSAIARSCDPLCRTIAECILPQRHLVKFLRSDFKVSARIIKKWHSLLLTLLAVPTFKSHLAAAYCRTYRYVTANYAKGMGVLERSGYTLSVQFLNRVTYVLDLVEHRDLLGILGKSILDTLLIASQSGPYRGRLDPHHPVLSHRRYSPCISDLKCVLNVRGVPRIFACEGASFMDDWISALSAAQLMDPHVWRHWTQAHVETESRGWVSAFNASISLGSLFERLLCWFDDDASPITRASSPYSGKLLSCVETAFYILSKRVLPWQNSEMIYYQPNSMIFEPHKRSSHLLPYSTCASKQGTTTAFRQIPIAQTTPFSFHLPLYRFVSSCLRELCLRRDDETSGLAALINLLRVRLSKKDYDALFLGLMEFPMLTITRSAQIRAGLWRRNGQSLNDQVLNYSEPPFCRTMRDADLILIQFAVLGQGHGVSDVGVANFVHLLIHRLGLFEFVGLTDATSKYFDQYRGEMENDIYAHEKANRVGKEIDEATMPVIYSPSRHAATSMLLLEEFLHTVIMFCSELPVVAPVDRVDQTRQAQLKLQREVIHRLASGSKTHSELSEVQHVLSYWDNTLLNDQGKAINPDDASGATLNMVLSDVAQRKASSGKMEPDKWEMLSESWESYDPAFFHISLRSHQTAAENRPKPTADSQCSFGWKARAYAPTPKEAHPFFRRLRRDISSDATALAVAYRILHLHCRIRTTEKDHDGLIGSHAYIHMEPSETALARAVNFLTLGAYAWAGADSIDIRWREQGGGSPGSIFCGRSKTQPSPTAEDWVVGALLRNPENLMDCLWYKDEDNTLQLLRRLAIDGGCPGVFVAQDPSVRAGAAWLCNFAVSVSQTALDLIGPSHKVQSSSYTPERKEESELDKRKRVAKEKAMERMKAQAAKFSSMMEIDLEASADDSHAHEVLLRTPITPAAQINPESGASAFSISSDAMSVGSPNMNAPLLPLEADSSGRDQIPARLLSTRPRCIICNDEDAPQVSRAAAGDVIEGHRKRSRRKTENALSFVAYVQASTVLKGGGGPPPHLLSPLLAGTGFVGAHIALCGHAVHSECCESYLSSVSHREGRDVGRREEFRCPLCQRLSNCLIPFIDVGIDWINSDSSQEAIVERQNDGCAIISSLHNFLATTKWWVRSENLIWDGHSAFIAANIEESTVLNEKKSRQGKSALRIRSLKKHDLYAAWSAMMRTPRFVRRKLRPRSNETTLPRDEMPSYLEGGEESSGEMVVWRRLMDQISDISYRADSKRLGDEHLHLLFGEFRHYIVEKYAYNVSMTTRLSASLPVDWPSCLFKDLPITESQRQEMSREKLLAKLILTIQAFTYSSCCESSEARRIFHKVSVNEPHAKKEMNKHSVMSKFGIRGTICDGLLIALPDADPFIDEGYQPFSGRLGKLRHVGLAAMAAAGAVAPDLIQLVLPFPTPSSSSDETFGCLRCPIAYPLLLGHVLTHITAAICATCGRTRAQSDALDMIGPEALASRESLTTSGEKSTLGPESLNDDCSGFVKLGLLARILQSLLGRLELPCIGMAVPLTLTAHIENLCGILEHQCASKEMDWIKMCSKLLGIALSWQVSEGITIQDSNPSNITADSLRASCSLALSSACAFLTDMGTILQLLVPGLLCTNEYELGRDGMSSFEKLLAQFQMEPLDAMLESPLVHQVVASWYGSACDHTRRMLQPGSDDESSLRRHLFRTEGYRHYDWPLPGCFDDTVICGPDEDKKWMEPAPKGDSASPLQLDILSQQAIYTADVVRRHQTPSLMALTSKRTAPLIGGLLSQCAFPKAPPGPRISRIPTSYTDLYAELGALLPNCEQIAVCLVCGAVLNAGGMGQCTRHTYLCGAGAGLFFLLQECTCLILHRSKAAYLHSPYVDSHGETPQFRGRPLNLDLVRYEHLREAWRGHGIRQMVVAERSQNRQVILNDFY